MNLGPSCRFSSAAFLNLKTTYAVKRRGTLFAFLTFLMIFIGPITKQSELFANSDISEPSFWADVLFFRADGGEKTLVEIFIEAPYSSLTFIKVEKSYEALVAVVVIYEDADGFQIAGNTRSDMIRTDSFDETLSSSQTCLFRSTFRIEPGSYTLRVMVNDIHGSNRFASACKITVPSFGNTQLQLSSLQLARHIELSDEASELQKNGRIIIPNVPHTFATGSPPCFLYFEGYNLKPDSLHAGSFQVLCRVMRGDQEIRSASWNSPKPDTKVAVSLQLNLSDLEPGEHMLKVTVVDQNGIREAGAVAVFYITRSLVWSWQQRPGSKIMVPASN
jgi:hypothetical protein